MPVSRIKVSHTKCSGPKIATKFSDTLGTSMWFWSVRGYLKSVNLEYNTLVCWDDGTNVSSTKHLMFQVFFFFIKSCKILCNKPLHFFFYKITKMKKKGSECRKSIRNYENKIIGTSNAWSMIHLSHPPSEPAYYILD